MIRYLGLGERRYGERPVKPYQRENWEFQGIINGSCFPDIPGHSEISRSRHLWIFPPGHLHGWNAHPGTCCSVVVMHVHDVPEPLRKICLSTIPSGMEIPLTPDQAERLVELGQQAERDLHQPDGYSALRQQRLWCDLCLLTLEALPGPPPPAPPRIANDIVNRALAWMSDHLQENPGIDDVARELHTSTAHLRRLFHRVAHCSPQQALQRLRLQRVDTLLQQPHVTLDAIAKACGLADGSSLSRWYRCQRGHSPSHQRTTPTPGRHRPQS